MKGHLNKLVRGRRQTLMSLHYRTVPAWARYPRSRCRLPGLGSESTNGHGDQPRRVPLLLRRCRAVSESFSGYHRATLAVIGGASKTRTARTAEPADALQGTVLQADSEPEPRSESSHSRRAGLTARARRRRRPGGSLRACCVRARQTQRYAATPGMPRAKY